MHDFDGHYLRTNAELALRTARRALQVAQETGDAEAALLAERVVSLAEKRLASVKLRS